MPSIDDRQQFAEQQFIRDALTRYRHQAYDLHLIGETIGPPTVIRPVIATTQANALLGTSPYPAREDHAHAFPIFSDVWQGWNPVITATTTNPGQGTGGTSGGVYTQISRLVIGQGQWTFGTAGATFGAGSYEMNLPVACRGIPSGAGMTVSLSGVCWLTDASAGAVKTGILRMVTPSKVRLVCDGTATTGASPTTPWTWAASDGFFIHFVYEAANA